MSRLSKTIVLIAAAAIAGVVVFLMTWDIPPPTSRVEVTISDDRLPQ